MKPESKKKNDRSNKNETDSGFDLSKLSQALNPADDRIQMTAVTSTRSPYDCTEVSKELTRIRRKEKIESKLKLRLFRKSRMKLRQSQDPMLKMISTKSDDEFMKMSISFLSKED